MSRPALRSSVLNGLVAGLGLLLVGCESPQRAPEPSGHAVVVYARERMVDANLVGDRLTALGFDVELQVEGPLSRERSSAAVYGLRTAKRRLERVQDAVAPLDDVEVLPFAQPGPGDTDVVVWLVGPPGPEPDDATEAPPPDGAEDPAADDPAADD